jgi:hypothetical protein
LVCVLLVRAGAGAGRRGSATDIDPGAQTAGCCEEVSL